MNLHSKQVNVNYEIVTRYSLKHDLYANVTLRMDGYYFDIDFDDEKQEDIYTFGKW